MDAIATVAKADLLLWLRLGKLESRVGKGFQKAGEVVFVFAAKAKQ